LPHAHARCDDRPVDASDISKAADDLYRAQRVRRPIPPLTTTYGAITVDDAYQIQLAWLANKVAGFGVALEPGHAIMREAALG
jgi:2-keto-4-pentenoate hydratase